MVDTPTGLWLDNDMTNTKCCEFPSLTYCGDEVRRNTLINLYWCVRCNGHTTRKAGR